MRAIAVLLVMLFHFETKIKGGYLGVDMFFVISGFVIASSTIREIQSTGSFSWSSFIHRRARRLIPGLVIVSVATAIATQIFLSPFGPQKEVTKMLLSAASYTSNFVLMPQNYFSLEPKSNPLLHLWSLAVEEQFYIVWPLVIVAILGIRNRFHFQFFKVSIWAIVLVVFIGSCWLFMHTSIHGSKVNDYFWYRPLITRGVTPERFAFYSPFTRAWEFLAGVLTALLLQRKDTLTKLNSGSMLSLVGVLSVAWGVFNASRFPEVNHGGVFSTNTSATLAVVFGTSVWILGGRTDKFGTAILSIQPLSKLGDWSYSIYLLHWPIWVCLISLYRSSTEAACLALVMSIVLGCVQYRWIEDPIRMLKKCASTKTIGFVGVLAVCCVVAFFGMKATTPLISQRLIGKMSDEVLVHIVEKPCPNSHFQFEDAYSCIFGSDTSSTSVVLVGDSMAKSLSDGFVEATEAEGHKGLIFSYPSCAFMLDDSPFSQAVECVGWRKSVLASLETIQPKLILVANLNSLYIESPIADWTFKQKSDLWGSELNRLLLSSARFNSKIIVVEPPPHFAFDLRYDLSLVKPNNMSEPRADVVANKSELNEIENAALDGISYVEPMLKLTELFCDARSCSPKVNGLYMYEDDDHLSVDGSRYVAPMLQTAISDALRD
jgi:peptidoglycan/LPS O-acetylase OafA/YrhL